MASGPYVDRSRRLSFTASLLLRLPVPAELSGCQSRHFVPARYWISRTQICLRDGRTWSTRNLVALSGHRRNRVADGCPGDRWWTGRTGRCDCGPREGIRRHGRRCLASSDRQSLRRRNSRLPVSRYCGNSVSRSRLTTRCPFVAYAFWMAAASIEASFPFGPGQALRRTRLHQMLTDRASELGVRLLWDTRVGDGIGASVLPVACGRRRTEFVRAPRCRVGRCELGIPPLWISPALPDFAVDRFRRSTLGLALPGLRDTCQRARGGDCAAVSRFPPAAGYGDCESFRNYREDCMARGTSSVERGAVTVSRRLRRVFRGTHRVGRRCVGIGGCNYRRRTEPLVSSCRRLIRGTVPGRPCTLSGGAFASRAASGLRGRRVTFAGSLSLAAPARVWNAGSGSADVREARGRVHDLTTRGPFLTARRRGRRIRRQRQEWPERTWDRESWRSRRGWLPGALWFRDPSSSPWRR